MGFCLLWQPSHSIAQDLEAIGEPVVYMILFEPNSAEITDAAKLVVDDAIRYYRDNNPVIVQIDGHYGRSESEGYADRMSREMAESVRDYVIENGIPAASIRLYWVGDREPVVSALGDVDDQFNRRVDISFAFSQE